MLKAAHPGGLIPPILHPSPLNRENTGERTDRTGALLFAGAVARPSCSDPWQRPAPWRHSA